MKEIGHFMLQIEIIRLEEQNAVYKTVLFSIQQLIVRHLVCLHCIA